MEDELTFIVIRPEETCKPAPLEPTGWETVVFEVADLDEPEE